MKKKSKPTPSARKTIETLCTDCQGTGLYQGMCEKSNEAVVCIVCRGTGCEKIEYTPFKARIKHPNKKIKTVRLSRGSFIMTGVGGMGKSITVEEFYAGKMPK